MGYFDLIDQVDLIVVLDNVQFVRQSWQHRNRIKTGNGLQWLTVPVAFRGRFGQVIKDVEIRDREFARSHLRAIELAYRRSRYFAEYFPGLRERLNGHQEGLLSELNLSLIDWALGILKISTNLVRASSLHVSGKRTELLGEICEAVGGSEYLSPLGSADYLLAEQNLLRDRGIRILFQNYEHPQYRQLFPPFESFASAIDVIFNYGPLAREIIQSGRREPFTVEQLSRQQSLVRSAEPSSVT